MDAVETYGKPHEFIGEGFGLFLKRGLNNRSMTGYIFEYLVCETLMRENITPFYFQAKFQFVPNADFDVVCYDINRPVVLSMKVSLRERWKQADLEGRALRQVYRHAEIYLITLSEEESVSLSIKINEGDVTGLTRSIIANKPEYSDFLRNLAAREFSVASGIQPIRGQIFPLERREEDVSDR